MPSLRQYKFLDFTFRSDALQTMWADQKKGKDILEINKDLRILERKVARIFLSRSASISVAFSGSLKLENH